MGGGEQRHHTEIRVLRGGISVTINGTVKHLGPNPRAILHTLILGMGEVWLAELDNALPHRSEGRISERGATKNALTDLRKKFHLPISENEDPVKLTVEEGQPWVDLWEFFDRVENAEYGEAQRLIPQGAELKPLVERAPHLDVCKPTGRRFLEAKKEVQEALKARSGRNRALNDNRSHLLERSLVPGIGREVSIETVRPDIEPIGFPWTALRPPEPTRREPLPATLAQLLSPAGQTGPKHLVVVGGPGAGKTLASISTFLLLTDSLTDNGTGAEAPPIFYVDGRDSGSADSTGPAPTSDAWLEEQLLELGGDQGRQPILVMPHADHFFNQSTESLTTILNRRLFREGSVLLCCSETFYERKLKFTGHGGRVFRLEPWETKDQKRFTTKLFPRKTWRPFTSWLKEDDSGSRAQLCKVPLHLSFVLPLIQDQADGLESISVRWHLLDQLARVRLDAAQLGDRKDLLFGELGAIAHHFYVPNRSEEEAIAFNLEDLEEFLRSRSSKNVTRRLQLIVDHTFIGAPSQARIDYSFEQSIWSSFFTARHLTKLIQTRRPSEPLLKALVKPLSKTITELCEEMLVEEFQLHEEQILGSLSAALEDETSRASLSAEKRTIATNQVERLLATVEDLS